MPGYAASWEDNKEKKNSDNYVKQIIDYLTNKYIKNINPSLLDDSIMILTKLPKEIDDKESVIFMGISEVSTKIIQENSNEYYIDKDEKLINVTIHSVNPIISSEYNKCYFEKIITTVDDKIKRYNKDRELVTYISIIKMILHFRFITDLSEDQARMINNSAFNNLTKYIIR